MKRGVKIIKSGVEKKRLSNWHDFNLLVKIISPNFSKFIKCSIIWKILQSTIVKMKRARGTQVVL